ncbi:MAG: succinate dehydrogenase, cytochrome b556 subunit [Rhodospirillaceae bacterium]|nr:succinate dehydrogenase, cytochrome b556 subunit [Rhodospirillaceae bacterium]
MNGSNRPLSPHLQVYKPQLTSVLSITHRLTGIALSLGTIFIICWLIAIASGEKYYSVFQYIITEWYGMAILLGFTWALFYHLCNGIRHLFWDVGYGFELSTAYKSGWATLVGSIILTAVAWILGLTG